MTWRQQTGPSTRVSGRESQGLWNRTWEHKDLEFTDFKRKLTIAAVVQVALVAMMNIQLYTLGGGGKKS